MDNKYRILIVENDFRIRQMLYAYFTDFIDQGYSVFTATTGECALNLIFNEHPHILIINDDLPDIKGKVVVDQLLKNPVTCAMHMIHLMRKPYSRLDIIIDLDLRPESRIDELTIPFDIEELRIRVENAIHRIESSAQVTAHPVTGLGFSYPEVAFDERFNRKWSHAQNTQSSTIIDIRLHMPEVDDTQKWLSINSRILGHSLAEAVREHGTSDDMLIHGENEHFAILTYDENTPAMLAYIREKNPDWRDYSISIVTISNSEYHWESRDAMRVAIEAMHTQ